MKRSFHQQAVLLNNIVHKSETTKFHIQQSNNRLPASIGCTMQPFIWNPGQNIDSNSGNAPRHEQNYPRCYTTELFISTSRFRVHTPCVFLHVAMSLLVWCIELPRKYSLYRQTNRQTDRETDRNTNLFAVLVKMQCK